MVGNEEVADYGDDADFDMGEFDSKKTDNTAYGEKQEIIAKPKEDMGIFAMGEEDTGDQFMAIKPFKGQVDHSIPDEFKKPTKLDSIPPEKS